MAPKFTQSIYCFLLSTALVGAAQGGYAQTLPLPDHVVVIIEENYAYSQIYGSSLAPHINALCNDTNAAVFSQFFAIEHPSQPNYLDMFSGANQGCTDDNVPANIPYTTANLAAQLISAGKTFITYSEGLPSVGFNGGSSGSYVRKHNPVTNWMGTGTNQVPTSVNQPFSAFPTSSNFSSLPTVSYVVPNTVNDMHDGSASSAIPAGDNWLFNNMDALRQWALANNTLFIFTFDEDDDNHNNQVLTFFYGPMVKGGTYNEHVTLFNLLRTIEQMYGLGYAGAAATTTAITDCWKTPSSVNNIAGENHLFTVYPNPGSSVIKMHCNNLHGQTANIIISDVLGRNMGEYAMNADEISLNTTAYATGIYYYKIVLANKVIDLGKFVIAR